MDINMCTYNLKVRACLAYDLNEISIIGPI